MTHPTWRIAGRGRTMSTMRVFRDGDHSLGQRMDIGGLGFTAFGGIFLCYGRLMAGAWEASVGSAALGVKEKAIAIFGVYASTLSLLLIGEEICELIE